MFPRPDVSEEQRTQIREAAIAVFARQGFDQARMDDIAQEAGLSKDAIISAILQFFFSQAMNKLWAFWETGSRLRARTTPVAQPVLHR